MTCTAVTTVTAECLIVRSDIMILLQFPTSVFWTKLSIDYSGVTRIFTRGARQTCSRKQAYITGMYT